MSGKSLWGGEQGECRSSRMAKRVSIGYTRSMAAKDVGLRIRVERSLRERFACRTEDKSAAQVIREFIRRYAESRQPVRPPGQQQSSKKGARKSEGAKE